MKDIDGYDLFTSGVHDDRCVVRYDLNLMQAAIKGSVKVCEYVATGKKAP
jgi:hypothetical protein